MDSSCDSISATRLRIASRSSRSASSSRLRALRVGDPAAQHVDFLHEPRVLVSRLRLLGAKARHHLDEQFDLFLEPIDRVEIGCARDRLLCHPNRLTCGEECCREDGSTMQALPLNRRVLRPSAHAARFVHRGLDLCIGESSVR